MKGNENTTKYEFGEVIFNDQLSFQNNSYKLVASEQNRHIKNPDLECTRGKRGSGGNLHRETCACRRKIFA